MKTSLLTALKLNTYLLKDILEVERKKENPPINYLCELETYIEANEAVIRDAGNAETFLEKTLRIAFTLLVLFGMAFALVYSVLASV